MITCQTCRLIFDHMSVADTSTLLNCELFLMEIAALQFVLFTDACILAKRREPLSCGYPKSGCMCVHVNIYYIYICVRACVCFCVSVSVCYMLHLYFGYLRRVKPIHSYMNSV